MSDHCDYIDCVCKYCEEGHCEFPLQGSGYPYEAPCFGLEKLSDESAAMKCDICSEWITVHGIVGDPIRLQVRNIVSYRRGQTEKTLIRFVGQGYDLLVRETPEEIDALIRGEN